MATVNYSTLAIGVAVIITALALIFRGKFRGASLKGLLSGPRGFLDKISATALIRYKATSRFEDVVEEVVNFYQAKGRRVLLISSASRVDIYNKLFSGSIQRGDVMLVKISASQRTDRFYLMQTAEKKNEAAGKIAEISVDWLEYLSEIIEGLPRESAVVFEPLSDIILMNGFDKTFKFIKKVIDYCASEGIKTIAFINEEAHEEMAKASFEGLFTNIAKMSNNRLEVVK